MPRSTTVDLQPIDRLEEKIRQLVGLVDTLRAERAKATDEVGRLQRDLETARTRLGEAEGASADLSSLREERELMRNRVVEMIAHIEKLNL